MERGSSIRPTHNFTVELISRARSFNRGDVRSLASSCSVAPQGSQLFPSGPIAGRFFFLHWEDALQFFNFIWNRRLHGAHTLKPVIKGSPVSSDRNDLTESLKFMFRNHVLELMEGDIVSHYRERISNLSNEIVKLNDIMGKPISLPVFDECHDKRARFLAEEALITRKLEEFHSAMNCVLDWIDNDHHKEQNDDTVKVFSFSASLDWDTMQRFIARECQRLREGLPLYAYRQTILEKVHAEQVIVLTGETGSGKSTQLVQYILDSGLAASGSVLCTQPRKISARYLAQRVKDESFGCYPNNTVACYHTYSSLQDFTPNIIFTTDNCLLRHCMRDSMLDGISYVIIDEAHERSLNTDLLLSLLKKLVLKRADLKLIVMSATVDVVKFSRYLFNCNIFSVSGRSFPVEILYLPDVCLDSSWNTAFHSLSDISYVNDTIKTVHKIHKAEDDGAILAFLTSQSEVEWACEHFRSATSVVLPLHGKLSSEEQGLVFCKYPGKRKIIFATNIAETSLTIPGIRYVVDSGMMKESRFEPGSGMSVLRVCQISQSSANQRAGRAGRIGPGKCYRLYSEYDFEAMARHQEPEICKVHLGVAILRILALGITDMQDFDFIDAPDSMAVELAINNLIYLGAVVSKNNSLQLTNEGRHLVKLGIQPALGKLILTSIDYKLCKEGLVLAAAMANAGSIFCRVGNENEKSKSDCLKVQFCHQSGDLFTLLSVYKRWEQQTPGQRNVWCWENSVNAKSMRRCKETVMELEHCLQQELQIVTPSFWKWDPDRQTHWDKFLKKIILSSLAENVAMYSGYDRLGYQVALTGQHVNVHPSCSLLIYGQRPPWVVFSELLLSSKQYLVCVTEIEHERLLVLTPPPSFDVSVMESQKMQKTVISGLGNHLLKRFCGKSNSNLQSLIGCVRMRFVDNRIGIEADFDKREIEIFSCSEDVEKVCAVVRRALENERKWLKNECIEKYLFVGSPGFSSSLALLGAGGKIKHLELEKRYLSVEVYHLCAHSLCDKELLMLFEENAPGIASFHKSSIVVQEGGIVGKWGKITFITPEAAQDAVRKLNGTMFSGSDLKVIPIETSSGADERIFHFPALKARLSWPRRRSKCVAIVRSKKEDVAPIVNECSSLMIRGRFIRCEIGQRSRDSIIISGLDSSTEEPEIFSALRRATKRSIHDVFLLRGQVFDQPSVSCCEEALLKEIANFMPRRIGISKYFRVQVFPPEPKDFVTKAAVTFDGSLHLEAARALEGIEGKVLSGCQPWQTIRCQQMFHSYVSCPSQVYNVIKKQLESLLQKFNRREGVCCNLEKTDNGLYRVKVTANGTKTVADLRRPLERLMKGKTLTHPDLTPSVTILLFSREGVGIMKALEKETKTYILHDKQHLNVKIFGPFDCVSKAEQKLIHSLLHMHENRSIDVRLRGGGRPSNLLKEVVQRFGPDLNGLKLEVPGIELTLNPRRHVISVRGSKEMKKKAEEIIFGISQSLTGSQDTVSNGEIMCPICLCEVEDPYRLEACSHDFCRLCLIEQFDSATKNHEGFPLCCTHVGCNEEILMVDMRALLSSDKLEDLFRASLGAFVASSGGRYRFCPSPDCPAIYEAAESCSTVVQMPFSCGACFVDTCRRCHMEYHPSTSCERYREFKQDPDLSLNEWRKGKENVKNCPVCGSIIEKGEGCNHVVCVCGIHICWVCLEFFSASGECYEHLRSVHLAIYED